MLVVAYRFWPDLGGMETLVAEITSRLAKAGLDIVVVTFTMRKDLPKEETVNGVRIIRVDVHGLPPVRLPAEAEILFSYVVDRVLKRPSRLGMAIGLVNQLFALHRRYVPRASVFLQRQLLKLILREQPDLIHVFTSRMAVATFPVTWLTRSAVVVTYPGTHWSRSRVERVLDKLCYSQEYDWFVMHEDGTGATKLARSMGVKHVSSFLAGVDGELFNPFKVSIEQSRFALGLPQEKFIIGMIGRIDRLKGVLEVVKSFLETARPGELLVIAGEANNSSYYSRLIQIIETHQNSQQVIFIGPMPHQEVPSFLAACDLLVFNSSFSNFHLALAETLMMGRASLVRDAGVDVIKEELLSCGSVKLYSNEDDELRRALEEARRGTSKERFSEQEHFLAVSLFGWDKVLGTIENAYAKTLLGHSK